MSAAASAGSLQVVDPHVHLWDSTRIDYPWLANPSVAYSGDNRLLPRIYDVAALLADGGEIEILRTVNIEANPADSLLEVEWLQACADAPGSGGHPHGIVGYADLSQPDAPALLERLAACRNVRGIRQILNVHSDPKFDYVGRHFLLEPLWRMNLRRLAQHALSFDLQLYPAQVNDALPVLDENANTVFIVNHAGMFVDRERVSGWREWRCGLRALASRPNTAIKLSGFAMFDHHWTLESIRPYVLEAIDAFGPRRCMFASNFPVDRLHGGYAAFWLSYAQMLRGASQSERADLLAGNALRIYRL
jgi:predicted TIM-barrel fold metal-dependent hydrolase